MSFAFKKYTALTDKQMLGKNHEGKLRSKIRPIPFPVSWIFRRAIKRKEGRVCSSKAAPAATKPQEDPRHPF